MQQVADGPHSRGGEPGVAPCRAARLCQLLLQLTQQGDAVAVCRWQGRGGVQNWVQLESAGPEQSLVGYAEWEARPPGQPDSRA